MGSVNKIADFVKFLVEEGNSTKTVQISGEEKTRIGDKIEISRNERGHFVVQVFLEGTSIHKIGFSKDRVFDFLIFMTDAVDFSTFSDYHPNFTELIEALKAKRAFTVNNMRFHYQTWFRDEIWCGYIGNTSLSLPDSGAEVIILSMCLRFLEQFSLEK